MQKNSGHVKLTVEVDPVTGEYMMLLPEWFVNDMGWYDGTQLAAVVLEHCEEDD